MRLQISQTKILNQYWISQKSDSVMDQFITLDHSKSVPSAIKIKSESNQLCIRLVRSSISWKSDSGLFGQDSNQTRFWISCKSGFSLSKHSDQFDIKPVCFRLVSNQIEIRCWFQIYLASDSTSDETQIRVNLHQTH